MVPVFTSSGITIIPAWLSPMPISSSAQIIPWLSTPRIFAFFMVMGSPLNGYMVTPTGATTTFCPAATLGAPQTICNSSTPIFTFVSFNLSASGCFMHSVTSPIINPCKPPLISSNFSRLSTSKPTEVRILLNFSGSGMFGMYSLSQL